MCSFLDLGHNLLIRFYQDPASFCKAQLLQTFSAEVRLFTVCSAEFLETHNLTPSSKNRMESGSFEYSESTVVRPHASNPRSPVTLLVQTKVGRPAALLAMLPKPVSSPGRQYIDCGAHVGSTGYFLIEILSPGLPLLRMALPKRIKPLPISDSECILLDCSLQPATVSIVL